MSREHLYKAKRVNWMELPKEEWWVEGYLYRNFVKAFIILPHTGRARNGLFTTDINTEFSAYVEVDPDTICEYIGLPDKNGGKIFENDIVGIYSEYREEWDFGVVKYGEFNCSCCSGVYGWHFGDGDIRNYEQYEIQGNIFDNPELLKGDEAE